MLNCLAGGQSRGSGSKLDAAQENRENVCLLTLAHTHNSAFINSAMCPCAIILVQPVESQLICKLKLMDLPLSLCAHRLRVAAAPSYTMTPAFNWWPSILSEEMGYPLSSCARPKVAHA